MITTADFIFVYFMISFIFGMIYAMSESNKGIRLSRWMAWTFLWFIIIPIYAGIGLYSIVFEDK